MQETVHLWYRCHASEWLAGPSWPQTSKCDEVVDIDQLDK